MNNANRFCVLLRETLCDELPYGRDENGGEQNDAGAPEDEQKGILSLESDAIECHDEQTRKALRATDPDDVSCLKKRHPLSFCDAKVRRNSALHGSLHSVAGCIPKLEDIIAPHGMRIRLFF